MGGAVRTARPADETGPLGIHFESGGFADCAHHEGENSAAIDVKWNFRIDSAVYQLTTQLEHRGRRGDHDAAGDGDVRADQFTNHNLRDGHGDPQGDSHADQDNGGDDAEVEGANE